MELPRGMQMEKQFRGDNCISAQSSSTTAISGIVNQQWNALPLFAIFTRYNNNNRFCLQNKGHAAIGRVSVLTLPVAL